MNYSKRSQRLIVFSLTFLVCLIAGLYYNFQRPPVYASSALLLTVAPPEVDQQIAEADLQHVTIQRQRLLSMPLLEAVVQRLTEEEQDGETTNVSVYQLQPMLSVAPVQETNLVELRAEGPDAAFLPRVVNTWLNSYLDERAEEVRRVSAETTDALRDQYDELGAKITRKREQLDRFRQAHDILSIGRDENQVLARLNGLTASLNTAGEEEVKAKARLDALRAAVRRGETVVPDQDKRSLAQMEKRAQQLREQLAELDQRYTRDYMALDPKMKVVPEELAKLERKIRRQHQSGRDVVVTGAEQAYAAARQAVRELRRQLEAHKREATEFTARFAEHEALQEDLAQLEELYRETEERMVQIEIKNRQKYPQVKVVEWAFQSSEPVRPLYLRDAGIVLLGSIAIALFMVWLVDFLTPKREADSPVTLTGVHIYPEPGRPVIEHAESVGRLDTAPSTALEAPFDRELSPQEVAALLDGADTPTRQLIWLLLAGLTAGEVLSLETGGTDRTSGSIQVTGESERFVTLPPAAQVQFEQQNDHGWSPFSSSDEEELDARLQLAAVDAGLADPEQINCQVLRHTYICYLVRQGIRLSDLEKIVGTMSPKILAGYGRFSPAGVGLPLGSVETAYAVS